jgi:hypothetical protein
MDSRIILAISGHGTCGKTTTSQCFSTKGLRYKYSTSEFAKKTIELPGSHADRSQHRVAWGNAIADFNNEDGGIKLYKMMISDHDILDGMRRVNELKSLSEWVQSQGGLFLSIWVDRDVPVDPSCEIRPEHCRFTINNRGSLLSLFGNVDIFWHGVNGLQ